MFVSPARAAFNPFELKKEYEEKLSAQQLFASTRYYALGARFHPGQNWSEEAFTNALKKYNFRVRAANQHVLAEDAVKLNREKCESQIGSYFVENPGEGDDLQPIYCWMWKNKLTPDTRLIVIQGETILQTFIGDPLVAVGEVSFDPYLVAQYKNNEPLIQDQKKLSDFPISCLNAVIAIEDNDFLDHSGVSYTGLARAILKNIMSFKKAQGGSTITQQLVKNYFLTPEKSYTRKAKELYMAIKLESQWTKDEILETYLNIIYMGQSGVFQVRGFPAASETYFGKSIDQLNLPECALLAAIINNPQQNNPWLKAEKALARRNLVLKKMLELSLISEADHQQALVFALPPKNEIKATETAPYFFEAVRNQAKELGIAVEGKLIFTTLDVDLQDAAQKALSKGIHNVTFSRKNLSAQKTTGVELQGAILSAENSTGKVNVFVGGQNYRMTQFNRALYGRRQIGSLVKPFIYLSGLMYADFSPMTQLRDEPFDWKYDGKSWKPDNYDRKFRGPVPYYYALKESLNVPTAEIAEKTKLDNIIPVLRRAGFTSAIPVVPAIALGVSEHTPLEVLQSYTTIASLGEMKKLTFIEQVLDENQNLIFSERFDKKTAFDAKKSAVLVGMMKQTVVSGTAKKLAALPFSGIAAGKTGTTTQGRDTWFAGFTPHITTVVWIGFDQNLPTTLTGASGAVPIWGDYMSVATRKYAPNDFSWPEGTHLQEFEADDVQEKVRLIVE